MLSSIYISTYFYIFAGNITITGYVCTTRFTIKDRGCRIETADSAGGGEGYVLDILEPHRPDLDDNIGKAKGFAEYARQNTIIGKIELIRMLPDTIGRARLRRLDLSMISVRDKVLRSTTPDDLNHLFETGGFYAD